MSTRSCSISSFRGFLTTGPGKTRSACSVACPSATLKWSRITGIRGQSLQSGPLMNERTRLFHLACAIPAAAASVLYATWSITRYERFGAGAWDLGCRSQSIWLLAHAKGFTSTVLGDVNFMGDHFMPSLALLAPVGWV